MPFYAASCGDACHSAVESRGLFLRKTVEGLQPTFPRYVACVTTRQDYDYATAGVFLDARRA